MISPNDHLKYNFEEYRGYIIASHKGNKPERHTYNINIVFKMDDFPQNGYVVGYDNSQLHGPSKTHANNLEDAKRYVDWIIEIREKLSNKSEILKDIKRNLAGGSFPKKDKDESKFKIFHSRIF
ncbi:hypothetical protein [Elizabethkingia anophelis]|uniref:hypothetical protein n=1 Tax=Elizabethkingia anophelis TaxID=1117645 RepID=UPI00136A83DB|nr:hypothetical protein [Elizabethkingia anophelis]MYY43935.1 hypothetical protein [Elizabethkingia anophelis]